MISFFKDAAGNPYWPAILTLAGWLLSGGLMFMGFGIAKRDRDDLMDEKNSMAAEMRQAERLVEAIEEYAEVATLNVVGKPDISLPKDGLEINTAISAALKGSYRVEGEKIFFLKDEASEKIFREVIARYPRFPFSYYALSSSLEARGDESWIGAAQQALVILERTVKISGHHVHHDQVLELLRAHPELKGP